MGGAGSNTLHCKKRKKKIKPNNSSFIKFIDSYYTARYYLKTFYITQNYLNSSKTLCKNFVKIYVILFSLSNLEAYIQT